VWKDIDMENQRNFPLNHRPVARRKADEQFVLDHIARAVSCAIVGVSNMGKSTLLRTVSQPEVLRAALEPPQPSPLVEGEEPGAKAADAVVCLYVDCNQALERTAQGFYELVLRRLSELSPTDLSTEARATLDAAYHELLQPSGALDVPLSFTRALDAILQDANRWLVLCLDEFDAILRALDGRALVHLRALHDQYEPRLTYVVATDRPLTELRNDRDAGEFAELFEYHTRWIGPLDWAGSRTVALAIAAEEDATFDERDLAFLWNQAGGHPGLLEGAARLLSRVTGAPERDAGQDRLIHQHVAEQLDADPVILTECRKLWQDLSDAERQALPALSTGQASAESPAVVSLQQKGLVRNSPGGPEPFSRLFNSFIRRQRALQRAGEAGVRLDVGTGHVYVEGRQIPPLTDLEYRLLLLLYGHLDEIVDKYQIVEGVWGQEYIDQVDDSRIERLVGRLREKIEPDPKRPQYLLTVRGRGYRLVG
jgi:hypothetical protein